MEARLWDRLQAHIDGMKSGLEVHVLAVVRNEIAPLDVKVDEALHRIRMQDERETIREQERDRAKKEERDHTDRAYELAEAVDKSIDGAHRRKMARLTAIIAIVTFLTGSGIATLISRAINP